MKPTLKLYLKPKYKIGSLAWTLNYGFSIADYLQNPTDDKLLSNEVVGYNIDYINGKASIKSYQFKKGRSTTGRHSFDFISKKAIKDYLKSIAIKEYRLGTGTKPRIERFILTAEERNILKL
jgi:hypothetical protein